MRNVTSTLKRRLAVTSINCKGLQLISYNYNDLRMILVHTGNH